MEQENESKVLVLELNEVPWKVLYTFVEKHPKSAFAKILSRCGRLDTHLPDSGQLHPKTSWQTFHRGVPDHVHQIREYNQLNSHGHSHNPTFWTLAQAAGKRVGCGASIGSWPLPENKKNIDFWFSDPFSPDPDSIPKNVGAFQEFNTLAVARSSRQVRSGGVAKSVVMKFLLNAPKLGIRPGTVVTTVKQLVSEKRNKARTVRRRNIQALMSFDVAQKQWSNTQPHLASIFINHVASAMHRYWAAAYPDDYEKNNMPQDWQDTYKDEINEAMLLADRMLAKVLKDIEGTNTTLLILGSMGQEGIEHEVTRNQLTIKDVPAFLKLLGVPEGSFERRPGMEPEYVLAFDSADVMQQFIATCQSVDINGRQPTIKPANDTECSLLVDQYNVDFNHITVDGQSIALSESGLHIENIQDLAGSTAQHTPEGMALVYAPETNLSYLNDGLGVVDVCSITSSILASLDVPVPDYMPEPHRELVVAFQAKQCRERMAPYPAKPKKARRLNTTTAMS